MAVKRSDGGINTIHCAPGVLEDQKDINRRVITRFSSVYSTNPIVNSDRIVFYPEDVLDEGS